MIMTNKLKLKNITLESLQFSITVTYGSRRKPYMNYEKHTNIRLILCDFFKVFEFLSTQKIKGIILF